MRIAGSLRQACLNVARTLFAPLHFFLIILPRKRVPVMVLTVAAASGAACAFGATQLTTATPGMQKTSQQASTQKAEAQADVSAQPSKEPDANIHISTNSGSQTDGASANTNITSTVSSTASGQAGTSVTVNGQSIPVPTSGTINRTIADGDGTTTVHVDSASSDRTTSSVHVEVNSTTTSGGER
jgi:hypothetical protein